MTKPMKRALISLVALLAAAVPIAVFSTTINFGTQPIANVANPALSTANLSVAGGKLYDVRFTARDPASDELGYVAADYNQYNIWSGNLLANTVDVHGTITAVKWQARVTLETQDWNATDATGRNIFTSEGGIGVKFRWADLSDVARELVDQTAAATLPLPASSTILDWVRGSHADETVNGGTLRTRRFTAASVTSAYRLGDIIHSGPVYVGPPSESYTFTGYGAFRLAKVNRTPMVYVGANDGMLHAFNATVDVTASDKTGSGKEVFAYIPSPVLGNLKKLTSTSYLTNHTYFVDGSPTAGDVCFNTCGGVADWRTVLVGGLNAGGQVIYALDITDPVAGVTDEASAASKFLWEFSDAADLGYTFGKPAIARLKDGTWVAIFGNGYNSSIGNAVLFVVNIQTGALIQKITTPNIGTPNGLASPTPLDTNADHVVDYVYAGDLRGNLWKFNFTAATAAGGVTVSYDNNALIRNIGQEITTAPKVAQNPVDGGYIVAFGTGKLLEGSDNTDTTTNYMYGIYDRADYTPAAGWGGSPALKISTVIAQVDGIPPVWLRFIENTTTGSGTLAGWALRLPGAKERVVNDPIIRSGRVVFTTVDPGTEFNQNWRMGVDYLTGAAPSVPYFDTNGDDVINSADAVDHDDDPATPARVAIGQDEALGVVSGPVAARIANDLDVIYVTHAVDAIIIYNPFQDPGLSGGHFDVDNFNGVGVSTCTPGGASGTTTVVTEKSMSSADKAAYPYPNQTAIVTTPSAGVTVTTKMNTKKDGTLKKDKKQITTVTVTTGTGGIAKCHIHQYDDEYNVNGVNLLYLVKTYDLQGTQRGTGMTLDGDTNLRELDRADYGLSDVQVIISLINPEPVMTTNPTILVNGVPTGGGGTVEPGLIKFNRAGLGTPISVFTSAWNGLPAFNDLPAADRTAKVKDITQLEVSFTNINALRATEPSAAQNKDGACGGVTGVGTKGYRDGALVIRATRADTGAVVYETALYEHLKVDTLLPQFQAGAEVGCGEDAENLRQYKDTTKFTGATPGSGGTGTGVTVGGGGEGVGFSGAAGTGRGVYTGTDLGQHNWRELLLY